MTMHICVKKQDCSTNSPVFLSSFRFIAAANQIVQTDLIEISQFYSCLQRKGSFLPLVFGIK